MITAVRLRETDKQHGFGLRTYVSAVLHKQYLAGNDQIPSDWYIVGNPEELEELEEIPQFEIRNFENEAALQEHILRKAEAQYRRGRTSVRAMIKDLPLEYQRNVANKLARVVEPRAPQQRDLSILEGGPAPAVTAEAPASADAPLPKGVIKESKKEIHLEVDEIEIDLDAKIDELKKKIANGGVTTRTMNQWSRMLRRLQAEKRASEMDDQEDDADDTSGDA